MTVQPTPTELATMNAATSAGLMNVPAVTTVPELDARAAVFRALAWHLARVHARLEGPSAPTDLSFKSVEDRWPESWRAADYPRATIMPVTTKVDDVLVYEPAHEFDVGLGKEVDVVNDTHALWLRGEDVGEGTIIIVANREIEANALARAVRAALNGDLDRIVTLGLPLPEAYLPPPFAGRFPVYANVKAASGGTALERAAQSESNAWRVDVHFKWQACTYESRPRLLPDFDPQIVVTVTPSP